MTMQPNDRDEALKLAREALDQLLTEGFSPIELCWIVNNGEKAGPLLERFYQRCRDKITGKGADSTSESTEALPSVVVDGIELYREQVMLLRQACLKDNAYSPILEPRTSLRWITMLEVDDTATFILHTPDMDFDRSRTAMQKFKAILDHHLINETSCPNFTSQAVPTEGATPESDAQECEIVPSANPEYDGPYQWVESSFARTLERQRDAEIRALSKDRLMTIAAMARSYKMSESAIRFIVKGKTWKHTI